MANFFSDSDEDKAVEEISSQAKESTVLEQVATINCAGFTDSALPSHLESRFQKLKSFPSSKPTSLSAKSLSLSHPSGSDFKNSDSVDKAQNAGENGEKKSSKCSMKSPESKNCLSPSKSSDSGSSSPFNTTPRRKTEKRGKKPPSWDDFSSRSVSPPAKGGCFLCSPKRVSSRKKSKDLDLGIDWGKQHDEILSDLSNSQRKMIKKAMKEEKRICREADKIVKWAKQASARMDISTIEDELSDNENAKFP